MKESLCVLYNYLPLGWLRKIHAINFGSRQKLRSPFVFFAFEGAVKQRKHNAYECLEVCLKLSLSIFPLLPL